MLNKNSMVPLACLVLKSNVYFIQILQKSDTHYLKSTIAPGEERIQKATST